MKLFFLILLTVFFDNRVCPVAPEHHPDLHGRSRLRRRLAGRRRDGRDAEHRSAGARRTALYRWALGRGNLHAVALCADDRRICFSQEGDRDSAWRCRADLEPGRTTLPSVLQKAGYTTGVVGKWHLGSGPQGGPDWNGTIAPGPLDVGFQSAFIMAATGDRVPTLHRESSCRRPRSARSDQRELCQEGRERAHRERKSESAHVHPSHGHDMTIVNGISRIGWMTGGKAALWKDEDMADLFTSKAVTFIEQNRSAPFFLYFATHDLHVPRVPNPRFAGSSGMGPRGDALVEGDWSVGRILETLDRLKLADRTLVIFTSDNGPVVDDGYKDQAVEKLGAHKVAGPLRGGKGRNFEGGTRVPFLVRWTGQIKPGVSSALVSGIYFLASFASFTGYKLADADAPDSFDVMAALLGKATTGRQSLVQQSTVLSFRDGTGNTSSQARAGGDGQHEHRNGNDRTASCTIHSDPGERQNLAAKYPEPHREMAARLAETSKGRSRP